MRVHEPRFSLGAHHFAETDTRIPAEREIFSVLRFQESRAQENHEQKNIAFTVQNGPFDGSQILSMFFVFFENPESVVFLRKQQDL